MKPKQKKIVKKDGPIKIRLTATLVVEYEPNPDFYPDDATPEEMLKADKEYAEVDPLAIFGDTEWKIVGQVIK